MFLVPNPRESSFYQAYESYSNPRLKDNGANYLNPQHIDELKDNSEIVVWDQYTSPVTVPGIGTLNRIGIQTKQGYTYDTLVGVPERPECAIPIIGTTAWTTSLRGHNERLARNMMRAGNYIYLVGHEGSYVPDKSVTPTSPISLASSAAAVLNFSYHMTNELRNKHHDVDPVKRLVLGESRGAMIAEGLDALAENFCQEMLFIDEVAPVLPEKLDSFYDLIKLGEQIAKEPMEMYRLLGKLTLARLRYYPKTIDIRLDCLRHQVMIGGALFSGETGALARNTPNTTLKHISLFQNDFASDHKVWEEIYTNHPLTRIVTLPGSHMTIGDLQTMRYVLARNKVAQECINSGKELTKANVFAVAHELVPYQFPLGPEFQHDIFEAA